jgi:hypothetical protein
VNTNHESVAYRSFSPSEFEARGARKVTTGIDIVTCHSISTSLGLKKKTVARSRYLYVSIPPAVSNMLRGGIPGKNFSGGVYIMKAIETEGLESGDLYYYCKLVPGGMVTNAV